MAARALKGATAFNIVSLAFGITTARVFPTLKYALGYGRTCTQVRVAGTTTAVTRRQAA